MRFVFGGTISAAKLVDAMRCGTKHGGKTNTVEADVVDAKVRGAKIARAKVVGAKAVGAPNFRAGFR